MVEDTEYLPKSTTFTGSFLEKRKPLALVKEVPTRWNSTFYMIKRILQLKPALDQYFQQILTRASAADLHDIVACKIDE